MVHALDAFTRRDWSDVSFILTDVAVVLLDLFKKCTYHRVAQA